MEEIDKRQPNNIKYYKYKASGEDNGDIFQLVSLILGIISFVFKIKWCCWLSLIFLLSAFVNAKHTTDQKQLFMNFSLIMMGFFFVYMPPKGGIPAPPMSK